MFTIGNYSYENCPKKCRNADHGERINSVIIKESLSDEKIAAFVAKTCRSFAYVLDHQGQSALHVAAAAHRCAIVEWLLNCGANPNMQDKQLGQTPLHRAIQYGYLDVAVLLQNYGASFEITDRKYKMPVQYCCKPKNYVGTHSQIKEKGQAKEILVWGTNRNYNLGLENKEGNQLPHHLDYFSKLHLTIRSVSMSQYHCLYIDEKGDLHAVGLGDGGRLGTNSETTLVMPMKIHLVNRHKNESVVGVSAAKYHSIVLTSENRIFACGLNSNGQLAIPNYPEKSLVFREVEIVDKHFCGVIAREHYSLAHTRDELFAWGLNVGQFGAAESEEKFTQPKKLQTFSHSFVAIEASDAAIACLTASGSILLFNKFKIKTLRKPIIHENVKQIAIHGGDALEKRPNDPLELLVVMSSDTVFLWTNEMQKFLRCEFRQNVSLEKIVWCGRNLLVLSSDGILYFGELTKRTVDRSYQANNNEEFVEQKSSRRHEIEESLKCEISLARISKMDRVTDVFVDQKGESFVALQENSKRYLNVPVLPDEPISFKALLTETNEFDQLHDIIFHVEDEIFPAHKFIIYSRAEGLRDIVKKYSDKHIFLNYKGLTSKMFELILKYIYENHQLSVADMEDVESSFDPFSGLTNLEIYTLFREIMGNFGVAKFFDRMMSNERDVAMRFNRLSYPELYDVTIRCAENAEIKAHRCILSSRLEYFNMMFNSSWSESTTEVISLTTVPKEYMEPIVNFLYNNDAQLTRKQQYTETFLYNLMQFCDQFFVTRLKNVIELMMIERMTARKCGDMFEFSRVFNCEMLEVCAAEFICQNMARLLENRCLDHLQNESLYRISQIYCEMFHLSSIDRTLATLIDESITDEAVLQFVDDFQIDLSIKMPKDEQKSKTKTKKTDRSIASDRRNYEKEAAKLVMDLSIDESPRNRTSQSQEDAFIAEVKQISEAISKEAQKWMTVADKKDTKRKSVTLAIKTNAILKNEGKERDNFTVLRNAVEESSHLDQSLDSSAANISCDSASDRSSLQFHLSLGDFTPIKATKISQKQRKRLLSQGENRVVPLATWTTTTTPETPIEPINPWKITTSTPMKSQMQSQPIDIASKGTKLKANTSSLSESFFSASPSTSAQLKSPPTKQKSNGSFSKILEDERKQREYYNKMKSKSLLLTQTEEAAIAELKKFYNIDNVFDEYIVIERYRAIEPTTNFAEWKYT